MRITLTTEARFDRLPDGSLWTFSAHSVEIWRRRFLDLFDTVRLVARTRDVNRVPEAAFRVDEPGLEVAPLPYYIGGRQFVRKLRSVRAACQAAIDPTDAVLFTIPSPIASQVDRVLRQRRQPYGVAVIGDPGEALSRQGVRHPLRPFLRSVLVRHMARQCAGATVAAYQAAILQKRYPSHGRSDVLFWNPLSAAEFAVSPREPADFTAARSKRRPRLVSVGSLEFPYKGMDTLLEVLARCRDAGAIYDLAIVGVGREMAALREQSERLDLSGQVRWVGHLPRADIRHELDHADMFVLASRSEGLPRALVEAMGRALPCTATSVGGIPEVLPASECVKPGNAGELASRLRASLDAPVALAQMSSHNLERAADFRDDLVEPRWQALLEGLRVATAKQA